MIARLFNVPIITPYMTALYTVLAYTRNDARLKAASLFEKYHGLKPARWEEGLCGRWIRAQLLTTDPDTPIEELDDGVRAAVCEPELLEIH